MGMSIRAYGRHRGVSDAAVRKAIKSGRIRQEPDGTLDADKADAQWKTNTDSAQQRGSQTVKPVPDAALDAVRDTLKENGAPTTGGTTFMQARTANEVLKAQTNRVRLQKLMRSVPSHVFAGAPRFHNGLMPDEFPAILQRGETVIPKNKRVGGMNVTFNVSTPNAQSFMDSQGQIMAKFAGSLQRFRTRNS